MIPSAFSGYGAATMFDYLQSQQWTGGFSGQVTVTAGSSAISSWTATVTLGSGQVVAATWNGDPTWLQANVMVMKPASYNSNLAAGQSTTFGFTVKTNDNYAAPAVTCATT